MNTRWRRPAIVGLATIALAAPIALGATSASAATPTVLYASPTGSGSACSLAAPCALSAARTAVENDAPTMAADIDVYLRGGTYRLTGPFTLGPSDSGENGHTVVYASYPGEHTTISGGRAVTGFALYDSTRGIYRAAVPAGTASRQLFVNGVRAQRARGPLNPSGFTLTGSSFVTADPSYVGFTNPSQVEIVDNSDWKQLRCPLAGITATSGGGSSLNVSPSCFANNNTAVPNLGFPFNGSGLPKLSAISWIENAYALLTQPGQFYLDSAAGYLYYIPRAGENLATADVELPVASELLDLSGTPGHLAPVNDTDPGATYAGSWATSTGRAFGDFDNDVHYTTTDGDSVSYAFHGTGLDVLTEINSDEGGIDVYVDGTKTSSVSAAGPTRLAQQPVVSVRGLADGSHTVRLVKTSGQYLLVDAFTVIPDVIAPVHDITWSGVTFADSTWLLPSTAGYVDNQAGVLWDPTTHAPTRIPAAVQVHRGSAITFTGDEIAHTGGTGIDLADGTRNSTVTASWIHDTSGGGVSLGEVDDYYLTDTALMTSGDTVSDNTIDHPGQDYSDAVGIWVGYSRTATISHNQIMHTPYSGMSLGWGWGWASDCSLQSAQGLANPCRHGTTYAGGNQILDNAIDDVMGVLNDGGPIYTNGGQGGAGLTSVLSGNVVSTGNHTNNMLYQDEGSSNWNTYGNVVAFGTGNWIGMWTPTIHDITVHDNWSSDANYSINGTNITFAQAGIVTNGGWPATAAGIIAAAGPVAADRPVLARVDDDDLAIGYAGSWSSNGFRGYGDANDQVHATTVNGDTASYTFTGTAVSVIGERNSDQGTVEVVLDGASQGTINTSSATRQVQQVIYATSGLAPTSHTIQFIKRGGTYATLDGFAITRTVDDTDPAIAYAGTWLTSSGRGLGDYGDGVHYTTTNGDQASITFAGTGIAVLTETFSDEGTIGVALDGVSQGTVSAVAGTRSARQRIYTVSGLPLGRHTLTLTKLSGQYLLVDRFDVS